RHVRTIGDEVESTRFAGFPHRYARAERNGGIQDLALAVGEHHPAHRVRGGVLRLLVEPREVAVVEIGRVGEHAGDHLALAELTVDHQRERIRGLAHRLLDGRTLASVLDEKIPQRGRHHGDEHRDHQQDEPRADGERQPASEKTGARRSRNGCCGSPTRGHLPGRLFESDVRVHRAASLRVPRGEGQRARRCSTIASAAAANEIAHTAHHPKWVKAVLARKAPTALPPQMCAANTVLRRLRALGSTEVTRVWLATMAARNPQSRSIAPTTRAATHSAPKPNTTKAAITSAMPSATTGPAPRRSIHLPAERARTMPEAPGMPNNPVAVGPRPCSACIIGAIVAQKPP